MTMKTVGMNAKIYDDNALDTQATAIGTAEGVRKIMVDELRLSHSHIQEYNISHTLDGKYNKLGFHAAFGNVFFVPDFYFANWCKNCIGFYLNRQFIQKLSARIRNKTGAQVSKYLGPYHLAFHGFLDARMVAHDRRTYKGFINNYVGIKRVIKKKLDSKEQMQKGQKEYFKKALVVLQLNGPFVSAIFDFDCIKPPEFNSKMNQSTGHMSWNWIDETFQLRLWRKLADFDSIDHRKLLPKKK
eukprot:154109_1